MTQLEILAARVRGADSNVEGGKIIAEWYELKTRSAANLARESAAILQKDADSDDIISPLSRQAASNFASIVTMLTGGESENNDNGNPESRK